MLPTLLLLLSSLGLAAETDLVLVPLPGSEVQVPLEPDFEVAKRWVGVANEKTHASIMVTRMDVGADKMVISLTPEALAPQGVKVTSSRPVRLGEYDGKWMEGTQAGGPVWIALVGDSAHSWIIKGSARTKGTGAAVVRMLEGAAWGEPAPSALAFEIDAPFGLGHARDMAGSRMFTKDGAVGNGAGKPLFIVAPSLQAAPITEETARATFLTGSGVEGVVVDKAVAIRHDGQLGWDLRGKGVDATTKDPMFLWQRMVFTPDGFYLRLVARAPLAEANVWLPAFEAAANSLRGPLG